jgi:polyisoprenoid-binding protein YceI
MKFMLSVLAAGLLAAAPAQAAQWNVDYSHSKLGFTVVWANEPFSASFKSWKAAIEFDPADLAHARADVTIDIASEASDESDFDSGLQGAEGFAATQFPTAHFVATKFQHGAGNHYTANGTLTLKGITKPVALAFTLAIEGKTVHMTGVAHVTRTDYGVGRGEWAAPTPVAHDVKVNIDLTATRN